MKTRERIGIDVDDTLLDFVGTYILYHNQSYNTNLKKENFKSYSFDKQIGGTMEEAINMINRFYETVFFKGVLPLPNSVEVISFLKQKNYELFIITSRPDFIKGETEEWLNKYFPDKFSNIFFSYNHYTQRKNGGKSKAEICLDRKISFMVDDSLEYCKQCSEKGVEALLFGDLPWNRDGKWADKIRVENWLKVGEKLLK